MTLSITYTDLTTNLTENTTLVASNKYIMSEKFNSLDVRNMSIESWKAETSEWNAGNFGRNSDVYLNEFLNN